MKGYREDSDSRLGVDASVATQDRAPVKRLSKVSLEPGAYLVRERFLQVSKDSALAIRFWPRPLAWARAEGRLGWEIAWPEVPLSRWQRDVETLPRQRALTASLRDAVAGLHFRRRTLLHRAIEDAEGESRRRETIEAALASVPFTLLNAVKRFREGQWRLFALAGRSRAFFELLVDNPALAFALAMHQHFRPGAQFSPRESLRLAGRKRTEIAGFLGFPPNQSAVKTLARIARRSISSDLLLELRKGLEDPQIAKRLAHVPRLNGGAIRLGCNPRMLATTTIQLLGEIGEKRSQSVESAVSGTLRDTLAMARQLRQRLPDNGFRSVQQLQRQHDLLVEQVNQRLTRRGRNRKFPEPPLSGTELIVPILDSSSLAEEGQLQGHCVGSYSRQVLSGDCYVYRVLAPERATLALRRERGSWALSELRAAHNREVGTETRRAVAQWLSPPADQAVTPSAPGARPPQRQPARRRKRRVDPRQLSLPLTQTSDGADEDPGI